MKTCNIEDCEKPRKARGWCAMHWQRWRAHGDPLGTAYRTAEEKFLAMTEPIVGDPAHIIWTGYTGSDGYGRVSVNGRKVLAHRYAYERAHGPIPEAMFIDHTCWQRACVNVDHLRLATHQQNCQNLSGANRGRDLPRGVYRHGRGYRAAVKHNGRTHYLGTFDSPELASRAASEARRVRFGQYAGNA